MGTATSNAFSVMVRPASSPGGLTIGNITTADYWTLLGMSQKVGPTERWVNHATGSDSNPGTSAESPWKTINHALDALNGTTGTIWVTGSHPDVGVLTSIRGASSSQILAVRGVPGTNARIDSDAGSEDGAIKLKGQFANLCFSGIRMIHQTYRATASSWSGTRSCFGILIEGAYPYEQNIGKVWVLNCSFEGFGHGVGGEGVPVHVIAGCFANENAFWVTGGGSGISSTRLGGFGQSLNWDLSPIYTAPDGTEYHYVQMGNVSFGNRQMVVSSGIGLDYQSDGNGIIFGDSELSVGRALQTLNVAFNNGGQGLNLYNAPPTQTDVVLNTCWNNGLHWDDGLGLNHSGLWTNEIAFGSESGVTINGSIIGNVCHALPRQNASIVTYGSVAVAAYSNIVSGKPGVGATLHSSVGITNPSDDINTADPALTSSSPARGQVAASDRKTDWDFHGRPLPSSGMIDAGAIQYQ